MLLWTITRKYFNVLLHFNRILNLDIPDIKSCRVLERAFSLRLHKIGRLTKDKLSPSRIAHLSRGSQRERALWRTEPPPSVISGLILLRLVFSLEHAGNN